MLVKLLVAKPESIGEISWHVEKDPALVTLRQWLAERIAPDGGIDGSQFGGERMGSGQRSRAATKT
jgi:hypothetical protein